MTNFFKMSAKCVPVSKLRSRSTKSGRHYTPAKTANFEAMIKAQAKIMMGFKKPTDEPVNLIVAFYFPVFKSWSKAKKNAAINGEVTQKPDVSNLIKSVEDALNGVVYVDDCQIVRIVAVKHFVEIGHEGVEIIVNLAEDKKWDQ